VRSMLLDVLRRTASLACLALAWTAVGLPAHAQNSTARISGTIVDSSGSVYPGVTITLEAVSEDLGVNVTPADRLVAMTTSTMTGRFVFEALSAGTYVVVAELSGFGRGVHPPIPIIVGQTVDIRLALGPTPQSENVTVVGSRSAGYPLEADLFQADFLRTFQLPSDRFQEALPLLPGVVRDPRGVSVSMAPARARAPCSSTAPMPPTPSPVSSPSSSP